MINFYTFVDFVAYDGSFQTLANTGPGFVRHFSRHSI
jgi:hypothetical protein